MKKNPGFTLIELLIIITVSVIAGSLLVATLVTSNSLFINQSSKVSQGLSLNDSVSEISELIKLSSSIVPSYPVSSPQYFTNDHTLVLAIPSIDTSGQVIVDTYDYTVIAKDTNKPNILRLNLFPDPTSSRKSQNKVLATNLSEITFIYLDNNNNPISIAQAVKVNFTINLTENNGLSSQTGSASGLINLKNN